MKGHGAFDNYVPLDKESRKYIHVTVKHVLETYEGGEMK